MRGAEELANVEDFEIFPKSNGKKLIFLDKEAILSRLTTERSPIKREAVDRFFYLSRNQSFYYTSVYIMAEVFSTVCSGGSSADIAKLKEETLDSFLEIKHGNDDWSKKELSESPKTVFLAAADVLTQRADIDCKFPEAALVIQAAAAQADYIFSYDRAVRKLSESFNIVTLPHTEIWKSKR